MIGQKTKDLTLTAMFIALSFVGAGIKVPSPTGTVAFDSAPGYMAALFLGPGYGALTAALGHLFTSMSAGFPLSLPLHLLIAAEMAFFAWVFGLTAKRSLILAVVAASLMNGILAPASFILIPGFGPGFFTAMVFPLVVASALNVAASALLYRYIQRTKGEDHAA
ncbi:ECF transporter S component [Thermosediminibacter litoriperuensis]|uniref:Alpha-ribazole transporter n=1 Tax=Thermosediminibacter litoriperuensis TaxID=291989 RepID=A0A5S5AY69_9FIRM|nr:ECF transporter S component [Thermosediminibacter litoriperuensis]TYP58810.1 alpha-ribazole transporter [Thermosediminibacter litoriperuensis]